MVCGFRKYLLNGFGSTGDFEIEKPSKCLEMLNIDWGGEMKIRMNFILCFVYRTIEESFSYF